MSAPNPSNQGAQTGTDTTNQPIPPDNHLIQKIKENAPGVSLVALVIVYVNSLLKNLRVTTSSGYVGSIST